MNFIKSNLVLITLLITTNIYSLPNISISSKYIIMPFDDYSFVFSVSNENFLGLLNFRNIYNFDIVNENKENLGTVNLYSFELNSVYQNLVGIDKFIYIVGFKVNYEFYYYFSDIKFGLIIGGGYKFSEDNMISLSTELLPYGNKVLINFSYSLFKDYLYLFLNSDFGEFSKDFGATLKTKVFSYDTLSYGKLELKFLFGLRFSTTRGILPTAGAILNYDWLSLSYIGTFQDVAGAFHEFGVELKRW